MVRMKVALHLVSLFLFLEGTCAVVWYYNTPTQWLVPSSQTSTTWDSGANNLLDNSTATCAVFSVPNGSSGKLVPVLFGNTNRNYLSDLTYVSPAGDQISIKSLQVSLYSSWSSTNNQAGCSCTNMIFNKPGSTSTQLPESTNTVISNRDVLTMTNTTARAVQNLWTADGLSRDDFTNTNFGFTYTLNVKNQRPITVRSCAVFLRAYLDIPLTLASASPNLNYGPLPVIQVAGGPFHPNAVLAKPSSWNPVCYFTVSGGSTTYRVSAISVSKNLMGCLAPAYGIYTIKISLDGGLLNTTETGITVNLKQCDSDQRENNPNCPSNAECVAGTCQCKAGFCGASCGTCQCSAGCQFGSCVGVNNCVCNATLGYYGPSCSDFNCTQQNNCGGKGNCTAPGQCICENGFGGDNCHILTTSVITSAALTTSAPPTGKSSTSGSTITSTPAVTGNPSNTSPSTPPTITLDSNGQNINNNDAKSSGGDKTMIIIIACVVGGCFLVIILVVIIVVLITRNRRRSDGIRFVPPDFNSIVFGKYLELLYAPTQNKAAYKPFTNLLLQTGLQVAIAIASTCPVTDKEHVSRALAHFFATSRESATFLMRLIDLEIEHTTQETTLFRGNSISIAVFQVFSKIIATRYLWDLFGRYIAELDSASGQGKTANDEEEAPSDIRLSVRNTSTTAQTKTQDSSLFNDDALTLEVDPNKMGESSDDAAVNKYKLLLTTQKFFQRITSSASLIPSDISIILNYVADNVVRKFPEGKYKAVGGFFFLRLIVPSITTPHVYGLLPVPPGEITQRNLVLLAKVLQNLANQAHFGSKEEHMTKLNDFITENSDAVKKFFDQISVPPSNTNMPTIRIPENVEFNATLFLHNYCHNNRDKILEKLKKNGQTNAAKELENVLDTLGAPAPLKKVN